MTVEFCPKCGNPMSVFDDGDSSRLCSICAWFGDSSETRKEPPLTGDLETGVRQALALYRFTCRNELLLEAAYKNGTLTLAELLRVRAKVAESEASLLALFKGVRPGKHVIPRGDNGTVAWPREWTDRRYNACNEPCDMLVGPCSCGAWHTEDEDWVQEKLRQHNAMIEPKK
jgi:hypothetical protein